MLKYISTENLINSILNAKNKGKTHIGLCKICFDQITTDYEIKMKKLVHCFDPNGTGTIYKILLNNLTSISTEYGMLISINEPYEIKLGTLTFCFSYKERIIWSDNSL